MPISFVIVPFLLPMIRLSVMITYEITLVSVLFATVSPTSERRTHSSKGIMTSRSVVGPSLKDGHLGIASCSKRNHCIRQLSGVCLTNPE